MTRFQRLFRIARRGISCLLALSAAVFLTGCDQDVVDLAISPGGRYLAYTTEKAGLMLVDTVTSAIRVIEVKNARPGGLAWSPTGASLAYVVDRAETSSWDLMLLDVRTGQSEPVSPSPAREFDPAFGADGRTLFFCSTRKGNADIFRYDLRSGLTEAVAAAPYDQIKPRVSYDGQRLAYITYELGSPAVRLVDLETLAVAPVSIAADHDGAPLADIRWAPAMASARAEAATAAMAATATDANAKAGGVPQDLALLYRDPARAYIAVVSLENGAVKRLASIDGAVDSFVPVSALEAAFCADGMTYVDGVSRLSRARLLKGLPSEQTLLALDPWSRTFAVVIGRQFVVSGALDMAAGHIWFKDDEQGLAWAGYLGRQQLGQPAVAQLRATVARLSADPAKADAVRLNLASALRESGQGAEARELAFEVFHRPSFDDAGRARRAEAARMLAEMQLFDLREFALARQWFKACADFGAPAQGPVCHAQQLMDELDDAALELYVVAVSNWRAGAFRSAAGAFEQLLAAHPENAALVAEAESVYLDRKSENFLRFEGPDGFQSVVERSPTLRSQARVAAACAGAKTGRRNESLAWLCAASYTLGDTEASRAAARRLIGEPLQDDVEEGAFELLTAYLTDAGQEFRQGWRPLDERRAKAWFDGLVEDVILSASVKDDLVFAWSQRAEAIRQLIPELAEMRRALRHGDQSSVKREQRFLVSDLLNVSEERKDKTWRLLAVLTAGLTAEAHMQLGHWIDARDACEKALSHKIEGDDTETGQLREYQTFLAGRLALLLSGAETSSLFGRLMDIEAQAVRASERDPAGLEPAIWAKALRGYVALLNEPEAAKLRAAIYLLMAEAYAAAGHPREQVIVTLQAALAVEPTAQMAGVVRARLAKEFAHAGDPFLAATFAK